MRLEAISNEGIRGIVSHGIRLFLWRTGRHMVPLVDLVDKWGWHPRPGHLPLLKGRVVYKETEG